MAKGRAARNKQSKDENSVADKEESASVPVDTVDTNRPQAEEKDLEDLLRDIEQQYEEEETKRKKGRKKKKVESVGEVTEELNEKSVGDVKKVPKRAQKALRAAKAGTKDKAEPAKAGLKDISDVAELTVTPDKTQPKPVASVKPEVTAAKETSKGKPTTKSKKADAKAKQIELIKQALAKQKEAEEQFAREEEERVRREEESENARLARLEEDRQKRARKREKEKARIQRKKEAGTYLTKEQREKKERALLQLKLAGIIPNDPGEETTPSRPEPKKKRRGKGAVSSDAQMVPTAAETPQREESPVEQNAVEDSVKAFWDDETDEETPAVLQEEKQKTAKETTKESTDEDSSDSSSYESESSDEDVTLTPRDKAMARIQRRLEHAQAAVDPDNLRCPVICVMGHVDTGKTKMLDNLRRTHVQDSEAGGITQQIGATNVPQQTIVERTKHCIPPKGEIRLPGFMFIDTPGHESFKNLRVRGSSLCDLAILIVDLMHGIEPQTVESLQLLRTRRCPFVIALNKIDRLNEWRSNPQVPVQKLIGQQQLHTRNDFDKRYKQVIVQLAEQRINAALFYDNPDVKSFYPMVPVSAVSGDGVGDLMYVLVDVCQRALASKIAFSEHLKCTIMEVKSIEGFGTTIDICLVNGRLRVGDCIVVPGQEGPLVSHVRGLLMPAHNKDLRVKNQYQLYKEVKGTRGVKVSGKNLEKALAGLPLYVAHKEDEVQIYEEELENQLKSVLKSFATQDVGVYVQASTLGSLEALLEFLNSSKIPFSGLNIGPIHRNDVIRTSIMLEKDSQWAVILAFDVRVERDAQDYADNIGVKIFTADIIYHLFDKFMAYRDELKAQNKEKNKHAVVFPCLVNIIPQYVFNTRDPIVVGVMVTRGVVKIGTPMCVIKEDQAEPIDIGRVSSIEFNHKAMDVATVGQEVCLKIESMPGETPRLLGRHFDVSDPLLSKISRNSIDVLKEHFRDEMQKADWQLIIDLKSKLKII